MQDTLSLLQRLQELEITLNEARILHGDHSEIEKLEGEVEKLRADINVDSLARYDRLSRHGLAIVQLKSGMCMGCNMSVPQGDLNRMQSGKADPVCPNCGRYLSL